MPLDALVIATLTGLAVGVERQWSGHATGVNARFGGLRTFTMMGLVAGIAGWWLGTGMEGPATVLLAGLVGIVIAAYVSASRGDVDATTEVAALVVVVAGVLAGYGQPTVASAITAVTVLLLAEKSRLHGLVSRLGETELISAARFAVMATVILPLLPADPIWPVGSFEGIRLRQLWMLVLFFSGLSFLGFLARRAWGARRGYAVAGALGGLVSSTSVTLTFSRLSRAHPEAGLALAAGVMGANVTLFPRVLVAAAVLAPSLAAAIWPVFLGPVAIGLLLLARGIRTSDTAHKAPAQDNPLQVSAALQMAVAFQIVLIIVALAEDRFGAAGLFGSAAVLGLTDVDALTVSMAQRAADGADLRAAAAALTLGILSNTIFKAGLALVLGQGVYRGLAFAGLLAMALVLGVGGFTLIPVP